MTKIFIVTIFLLILIGLTCCKNMGMTEEERLIWDIFNSKDGDPPIVVPSK